MFSEKLNYSYLKNINSETLILFLHGWGCDMKSFKYFEGFFSSQFNVLNIDLYGFGESELPSSISGVYDYAKNIYLLIKKFKYNNLIIICHSFGFRIATLLLTCFDLEVSELVVTGGAGLKPRFNLKVKLKICLYKLLKNRIKLKRKYVGSDDYKSLNFQMKKVFVAVVNQHLNYLIKDIKAKTFLFWGMGDKDTPIYMARKLNKLIVGSKLKIVRGGHFTFIENRIYFAECVLKFILSNKIINK